jgi:putative nucleotidyltransferase with HDIG domain
MVGKKLELSSCREGDILAADVINEYDVVLVAKDTVLNDYIIERLCDLGVKDVRICRTSSHSRYVVTDSILDKEYHEVVLQTKELLQELAAGKPLECEKVYLITDQIHKSINENGNIIRLLTQIKSTDDYTYTHSVNTAFYSMLISKWLGLPDQDVRKAIQSGLLHDIGKTKIPPEILNKKGRLTDQEFDIIKSHPVLGYDMVKDIAELDNDIKLAVLLHHERMNGSGYPYHYFAEGMNLFSRIVALADVFDAMTSDRVYKKRSTPFDVFDMYQTEGVCLFDTKMLFVFMKNIAVNLIGANVLLNNGKLGEIVYVPFHSLTTPVIKVASEYLDISEEKTIQILSII